MHTVRFCCLPTIVLVSMIIIILLRATLTRESSESSSDGSDAQTCGNIDTLNFFEHPYGTSSIGTLGPAWCGTRSRTSQRATNTGRIIPKLVSPVAAPSSSAVDGIAHTSSQTNFLARAVTVSGGRSGQSQCVGIATRLSLSFWFSTCRSARNSRVSCQKPRGAHREDASQ